MATTDGRGPTDRELLPPEVAARRLGVSPRTLLRYATASKVPSVLLPSGIRRYRPEDIDAVVATGLRGTRAGSAA